MLIFYGGTDKTFEKNFGYSKEKARKLYLDITAKLKGLTKWQNLQKRLVWQRGYILISHLTGHKAHIYDYEDLMEERKILDGGGWEIVRNIPTDAKGNKYPGNEEEAEMLRIKEHYVKRKSESEKQALDYGIQGTGAQLMKLAYVKLFKEICERKWVYDKVKFCIQVHDECNSICVENIVEDFVYLQEKCMKDAGDIFTEVLHLDVNTNVGNEWIH